MPKEIKDIDENQNQGDSDFDDLEEGFSDTQTTQVPLNQNTNTNANIQVPAENNVEVQMPQRPFSVEEPQKPQVPLPSTTQDAAPLPGA